jgi:hypothetical protein
MGRRSYQRWTPASASRPRCGIFWGAPVAAGHARLLQPAEIVQGTPMLPNARFLPLPLPPVRPDINADGSALRANHPRPETMAHDLTGPPIRVEDHLVVAGEARYGERAHAVGAHGTQADRDYIRPCGQNGQGDRRNDLQEPGAHPRLAQGRMKPSIEAPRQAAEFHFRERVNPVGNRPAKPAFSMDGPRTTLIRDNLTTPRLRMR